MRAAGAITTVFICALLLYGASCTASTSDVPEPTPYPTSTSISVPSDTLAPSELYEFHDYYPIILSLSDDRGNVVNRSYFNGYDEPYGSFKTGTVLGPGDEICLTVEAHDPQGRQLLYHWRSNSDRINELVGLENGTEKWTTNNQICHVITEDDIQNIGDVLRIGVDIRSEKGSLRFVWGGYDDSVVLDYIAVR